MATVKVKWRASNVAGKPGTIYYQVIHRRMARQLKTSYKMNREEMNAIMHVLDRHNLSGSIPCVAEKVAEDLARLHSVIAWLEKRGVEYSADDVVEQFRNDNFGGSFMAYLRRYIAWVNSIGRYRQAETCTSSLNSFSRFLKGRDVFLDEVDSSLIIEYEMYLRNRGITLNTSSFYMRNLRAVYNRAVDQGLTVQRNPFKRVYTGVERTVKRALPLKWLRALNRMQLDNEPELCFARDLFMFSFYTRGMSFVDMAYLRKNDVSGGLLTYSRRKTRQRITVKWEPCMQDIVDRYALPGAPYLLPIITDEASDARSQYLKMSGRINRRLRAIGNRLGLPLALTMYVSRHTWASIARCKNIPIAVISEGLGHDSELTTRIYLSSLDCGVVDKANRMIIDDL